jgi:hypothetical protein
MISNVEIQVFEFDTNVKNVLSEVITMNIKSEVDEDYRDFNYRITDENDLRITDNDEPREV